MALFLFEHLVPQPQFLKIAKLDRATIENWTRSGALSPASQGRGKSPLFRPADFLKVRLMQAFKEQLSCPPARSAAIADTMLDRFGPEFERAVGSLAARLIGTMRGEPVAIDEGDAFGPFVEPVFSATFALSASGDGGLSLSVDNHMPGAIVILPPLRRWTKETAFDFVAAVLATEGAEAALFDQIISAQEPAK